MKKHLKKQGFTLVEIMIVVMIIGLLAAIGIPSFAKARENSIYKSMENNARMVNGAVEQYMMETAETDVTEVGQDDIEDYIRGGWASLNVGSATSGEATFPTDKTALTNNVTVLAAAMYTGYPQEEE